MEKIEQILKSKEKPKAKVEALADLLQTAEIKIADIITYFPEATDSEKGSLVEAIEFVTRDNPSIISWNLAFIIENLIYNAPRVKWETARVIGNIAQTYPDDVEDAIPHLLLNVSDKGTVVRWSAAFALSEIAKYNVKQQNTLVKKFEDILKTEENNGVRNVYLKAIKFIQKNQLKS